MCVQNKALVSKVVMIAIPGLEAELFKAKQVRICFIAMELSL